MRTIRASSSSSPAAAPAAAARRPGRDRRPERARLPRPARAGDPRPAHRPLNRRFVYEAFATSSSAPRYGTTGSIVLIDVDDFKQVNDTLGHTAGDGVLCEIGRIADDDPPGRQLRPRGRRGVRAAAARDLAARGADRGRAAAPAVASAAILPDRTRHDQRAASPPGPRTGPCSRSSRARPTPPSTGRSATARTCAPWRPRSWCRRPPTSATGCSPTCTRSSRRSTPQHLNTRDHSQNVAAYAAAIGEQIGPRRASRSCCCAAPRCSTTSGRSPCAARC